MWERGLFWPEMMAVFGALWLVLLAVGVGLIVWLLTRRSRPSEVGGSRGAGALGARGAHVEPGLPRPLAILDERLARGEIDVDTYRTLRAELTAPGSTPSSPAYPSAQ